MSSDGRGDPVEKRTRRLSLAVRLLDAFTGEPLPARHLPTEATERLSSDTARRWSEGPSGRGSGREPRARVSAGPTVSIAGVEAAPVVNPDGYLLYFETDLPRDGGDVDIRVDGGRRYLDESVTTNPATLDAQHPVVSVELHPAPGYRFPAGTTLVRGLVVDDRDGQVETDVALRLFGLAGVSVSLDGVDRSVETTADGEFVLFVKGLTADRLDDGRVRIDGDSPRLSVDHPDAGGASAPVEILEGRTACYHFKYDAQDEVSYRRCETTGWTDLTP